MTNRRRYFLIIMSVTLGTILSGLMIASRGAMKGTDYLTLFFNMAIAAAVIIALGIVFKTMDRKHKKEEEEKNKLNEENKL